VSWEEDGRTIRSEIWEHLILPGMIPNPKNPTFWIVAIYAPLYSEPWLLATDLPIKPVSVKGSIRPLTGGTSPFGRKAYGWCPSAIRLCLGEHSSLARIGSSCWFYPKLPGRNFPCYANRILGSKTQAYLRKTTPDTGKRSFSKFLFVP